MKNSHETFDKRRILYLDEIERMIKEVIPPERTTADNFRNLIFRLLKIAPLTFSVILLFVLLFSYINADPPSAVRELAHTLNEEMEKEHIIGVLHLSTVIFEILLGLVVFILERTSKIIDLEYIAESPSIFWIKRMRDKKGKNSMPTDLIFEVIGRSDVYMSTSWSLVLSAVLLVFYILFLSILVDSSFLQAIPAAVFFLTTEAILLTGPILYLSLAMLTLPGHLTYRLLSSSPPGNKRTRLSRLNMSSILRNNKFNNKYIILLSLILIISIIKLKEIIDSNIASSFDISMGISLTDLSLFLLLILIIIIQFIIYDPTIINSIPFNKYLNRNPQKFFEKYLFYLITKYHITISADDENRTLEIENDRLLRELVYVSFIFTIDRMLTDNEETYEYHEIDEQKIIDFARLVLAIGETRKTSIFEVLLAITIILFTNEYLVKYMNLEGRLVNEHVRGVILEIVSRAFYIISEEHERTSLLSSIKFIISYALPYLYQLGYPNELLKIINQKKRMNMMVHR